MSKGSQSHWIPLSDMMTGMMLVFMLIAIVYMVRVQQVATDLKDIKGQIYTALDKEFGKDLKKWDADILPNLTVRFNKPDGLFPKGEYKPNPKFKQILNEFIPRYLKIVENPKFKDSIKEILIEGHTDKDYESIDDPDVKEMTTSEEVKKYMNNMTIAVSRSWFTLRYLFEMQKDDPTNTEFLIKKMHLHDVSSAYPIIENGQVNPDKSRRVEFRIITNSDERLDEIATALSKK